MCVFSAKAINSLLDSDPVDVRNLLEGSVSQRMSSVKPLSALLRTGTSHIEKKNPETNFSPSCRSFPGLRRAKFLRSCLCTCHKDKCLLNIVLFYYSLPLAHLGQVVRVRASQSLSCDGLCHRSHAQSQNDGQRVSTELLKKGHIKSGNETSQ